jgi:hypothetical protein
MAPLFQITALLLPLAAGFLPPQVPPDGLPETERFIGSFDWISSQDYPNGTTRSDTISYFFGMQETAILIHARKNQPDMRLVINPADSTITGLFEMQGKKGGYILPMNDRYWPGMRYAFQSASHAVQSAEDPSGDSKMIEGYRCRRVLAESSDYTAELWMTDEIPLSMPQVLSYQAVGAGKSQKELEQFDQFNVEGLPLEMALTSKKGKANVAIRLVNFQETVDESIFSREGHTLSAID